MWFFVKFCEFSYQRNEIIPNYFQMDFFILSIPTKIDVMKNALNVQSINGNLQNAFFIYYRWLLEPLPIACADPAQP